MVLLDSELRKKIFDLFINIFTCVIKFKNEKTRLFKNRLVFFCSNSKNNDIETYIQYTSYMYYSKLLTKFHQFLVILV